MWNCVANNLLCVVAGALVVLVYHQPCPGDGRSNGLQACAQSGWTMLTAGIVDWGAGVARVVKASQ